MLMLKRDAARKLNRIQKKPRVDDTVAITVLDSFTENDPQSKVCNSLITSQKNVNIEACDIVCNVIGEEYC